MGPCFVAALARAVPVSAEMDEVASTLEFDVQVLYCIAQCKTQNCGEVRVRLSLLLKRCVGGVEFSEAVIRLVDKGLISLGPGACPS